MTIASLIVDVAANTAGLTTGADQAIAQVARIEQATAGSAATIEHTLDKAFTSPAGPAADLASSVRGLTDAELDAMIAGDKLAQTGSQLAGTSLPQLNTALTTVESTTVATTQATETLAASTNMLMTKFSLYAAGAVIVGEAIAKIATAYGDWEVAQETALAKYETWRKAVLDGAPATITYADAVKYNAKRFEELQASIPEVAVGRYNKHLQEMWQRQVDAALAARTLEIGLARIGTVLGEADIGEKLKQQFEDGAKAAAAAAREQEQYERGLLHTLEELSREYDRNVDAINRVEAAIGFNTHGLRDLAHVGLETKVHVETLREEIERLQRSGEFSAAALLKLQNTIQTLPNVMSQGKASIDSVRGSLDLLHGMLNKLGQAFSPTSLFSNLVRSGMNAVFGPSGIITSLAEKGLEALGNLVLKGLSKIGGYFKRLFGGPDADELAGRDLVDKFQANFSSVDDMINKVGEAVRAAGGTSEEAQALIKAMWDAEKNGAGATQAAIQKIIDILNKVPTNLDVNVNVHTNGSIPNDFPLPPDIPIEPMAGGGMGRITGPTLFYSRGDEDFAFSGEGKRFGGGGSGAGQEIHTHVYLDGREIAVAVNRHNDRDLRARRKLRAA